MQESNSACSNCKIVLPSSKIDLHEAYCLRNVRPCPKCGEFFDKSELSNHDLEQHSKKKCEYCSISIDLQKYESHIMTCTKKPKKCNFCELDIDVSDWANHVYACGSRTKKCMFCQKNVIMREYEFHISGCTGIIESKPIETEIYNKQKNISNEPKNYPSKSKKCTFCGLSFSGDDYSNHVYSCGNQIKKCVKCQKNVILREYEFHITNCIGIVESKPKENEIYKPNNISNDPKYYPNKPKIQSNQIPKPAADSVQKTVLYTQTREKQDIPSNYPYNYKVSNESKKPIPSSYEPKYPSNNEKKIIFSNEQNKPTSFEDIKIPVGKYNEQNQIGVGYKRGSFEVEKINKPKETRDIIPKNNEAIVSKNIQPNNNNKYGKNEIKPQYGAPAEIMKANKQEKPVKILEQKKNDPIPKPLSGYDVYANKNRQNFNEGAKEKLFSQQAYNYKKEDLHKENKPSIGIGKPKQQQTTFDEKYANELQNQYNFGAGFIDHSKNENNGHEWKTDPRNMDFNESFADPELQEIIKRSMMEK